MAACSCFGKTDLEMTYIYTDPIYVDALNGNDDNIGDKSHPLKTISTAVSKFKWGYSNTVVVREGVYRECVNIPSAYATNRNSLVGYSGERVIIDGSEPLNLDWSYYKNNIYVAPVNIEFDCLFSNNQEMILARYPNAQVDNLLDMDRLQMASGSKTEKTLDDNGDLLEGKTTIMLNKNTPIINCVGAGIKMWPGSAYDTRTSTIKTQNEFELILEDVITYKANTLTPSAAYEPREGNYFYLYNKLEFLDSPGEWFLNKENNLLYFYTPNGQSPEHYQLSYKTRTYGLVMKDTRNVDIYNINLFGCAVQGDGVENCVLDKVNIKYVDYDVFTKTLGETNRIIGHNNKWLNSRLEYAWGNGITVSGNNNVINNCKISNVGIIASSYSSAIKLSFYSLKYYQDHFPVNTTITNCDLYNSGRFIISHTNASKTKIMHCDISKACRLTLDGGAVYCWGTNCDYSEIAYNYIHDNNVTGYYSDNRTSQVLFHHNIVADNAFGIQINPPETNSYIAHNCFYNNDKVNPAFYVYSGEEGTLENTVIINNIWNGSWDWRCYNDPEKPQSTIKMFESNLELSCNIDKNDYFRVFNDNIIDAGIIYKSYPVDYIGNAPDIGAIELGAAMFSFGSNL